MVCGCRDEKALNEVAAGHMKQFLCIVTGVVIVATVAVLGFRTVHKAAPQEAKAATMPLLQTSQAVPVRTTSIKDVFQGGSSSAAHFANDAAEMLQKSSKGQAGSVTVAMIGDQLKRLSPDDNGLYERVYLQPKQKIALAVAFPRGEPGQKIAVESQDGGVIGENGPVQVLSLDARRQIAFVFQATENTGLFRVTLRQGANVEELNFWVGPELVYAPRALAEQK